MRGLLKQLVGLLVVGTATAYVITGLLYDAVPAVGLTQEVLLRSMPTTEAVVLSVLVAIGAGAAASLALTADPRIVAKPWGQIIDTMIGVEIAISLMPPAAVIGIGLAFGMPEVSRNAFYLVIVNVQSDAQSVSRSAFEVLRLLMCKRGSKTGASTQVLQVQTLADESGRHTEGRKG